MKDIGYQKKERERTIKEWARDNDIDKKVEQALTDTVDYCLRSESLRPQ